VPQNNIWQKASKLKILAPMDDVTDVAFRRMIFELGPPDIFFTEFVNVDGLNSAGRPNLVHKLLKFSNTEDVIAQVWGLKPENFQATAKHLVEMGFKGVDINMGCPVKDVIKTGAGSAMIENPEKAREIIESTRIGAGGKIPVSVKTRIGFKNIDLGWIEFLLKLKLPALTVHLRTQKEMSKVPAHWDILPQILNLRDKLSPETKIIANGDVFDKNILKQKIEIEGLNGVMIGRGIFHDPFIFNDQVEFENLPKDTKLSLMKRHIELYKQFYMSGGVGENGQRRLPTLFKFAKVYISGFDGAVELRTKMMQARTLEEFEASSKS
jgi:tRNA-dihydrouridine synthase